MKRSGVPLRQVDSSERELTQILCLVGYFAGLAERQ